VANKMFLRAIRLPTATVFISHLRSKFSVAAGDRIP